MKKVIITGASRGIGLATVNKFLNEGWFVIGASTKEVKIINNINYHHYILDLNNPESVKSCTNLIVNDHPKINSLINCAGTSFEPDPEDMFNTKALRKNLEVNLIGTINFTENLLPTIEPLGQIIIISSMMSSLVEFDKGDYPAYRVSKTALNMYSKVLASRLKEITVSVFDPGWVKTDMGGPDATRDPSIPAQELFDLATKSHETGKFWFEGKVRSW